MTARWPPRRSRRRRKRRVKLEALSFFDVAACRLYINDGFSGHWLLSIIDSPWRKRGAGHMETADTGPVSLLHRQHLSMAYPSYSKDLHARLLPLKKKRFVYIHHLFFVRNNSHAPRRVSLPQGCPPDSLTGANLTSHGEADLKCRRYKKPQSTFCVGSLFLHITHPQASTVQLVPVYSMYACLHDEGIPLFRGQSPG